MRREPTSREGQAPRVAEAEKKRSTRRSPRQPFDDVLGVDLIGFVIAGQRVHDEIDAAPQCELALPTSAGNERKQRTTVGVAGPRCGQIVGDDDDGGDAVASPDRAVDPVVRIRRGQRLDPRLANFGPADEFVRGDRRSWSAHDPAAMVRARARRPLPAGCAATSPPPSGPAGTCGQRVARVEYDCPAVFHVCSQTGARFRTRLRPVGDDRPVDEGIEGELVACWIKLDRIAEVGGRPGGQHARQG